jgi:hypothetical protein
MDQSSKSSFWCLFFCLFCFLKNKIFNLLKLKSHSFLWKSQSKEFFFFFFC